LWWFELPRLVENNSENRQVSIVGFLYVAKTIEGWLNNCISYLVYSQICLILSRDNLHFFYGWLPLWLHQKILKKNSARVNDHPTSTPSIGSLLPLHWSVVGWNILVGSVFFPQFCDKTEGVVIVHNMI